MWPFGSPIDRQIADVRKQVELADLTARLESLRAPVQNSATATFPLSDPLAYEKLFGLPSQAMTAQKALTSGAVYRSVFLIAASVSMLRLRSYTNVDTPDEQVETGSVHARLLGERPNPRYSRTAFWRSVVSDMLLSGNGIVWIERLASGQPFNLWWVPWGRVGIHFWTSPLGTVELLYHCTLDDGRIVTAAQDDVMHFGGSTQWNLFYYLSPLSAYAQSVGVSISAGAYAKAYFDNGYSSDAVISYPTPKTPEQGREIRAKVNEQLGGQNRFSGPLILDGGATFNQIKLNAADAQLLESRQFSINEIGMIFGVPGHLLNQMEKASAFGKGLEEMTQAFLDFTLGPHLDAIEDEVNWKLYGNRARAAKFDRDSFTHGDLKSRADAIQTMLGGAQGPGVISRNEARAKLNMPRLRGGQNDKMLDWPAKPSAPASEKPAAEPPSPAGSPALPAPESP